MFSNCEIIVDAILQLLVWSVVCFCYTKTREWENSILRNFSLATTFSGN